MRIGFIGLGRMGSSMARNLLDAGHHVTVYNRSREKAEALSAHGAHIGSSLGETCAGAEAVLSMVSDDQAAEAIAFGPDGIDSTLPAGAIHISHSTIGTACARRLAEGHAAKGQGYISAPVFGRPEAAETKRLIVVAAGEKSQLDKVQPLFDAVGRATYIAGSEPGQANAVKVCGNFMIASLIETFGEAFAMLRKSGVNSHIFLEVMNELFQSPVYKGYGQIIADEKYEPAGFALRLGLKDAKLVLATAEECASPMPLATLIRDHFLDAMAHGQSDMDWSSLAKVSERNAGL